MFVKPFKIKSNSILKGCERKKLLSTLTENFPTLNVEELIPHKSELSVLKVVTFKTDTLLVYCQAQNPIFFLFGNLLLPTVYTLWKFPTLLPTVATCSFAFNKMSGGADLMLPGIEAASLAGLESIVPGDQCAIRISGTQAPIGVGVFLLSGADLLATPKKGKAISVRHLYKDMLWAHGSKIQPPQELITPKEDDSEDEELEVAVQNQLALDDHEEPMEDGGLQETREPEIESIMNDLDVVDEPFKTPVELMDDLLIHTVLSTLKNAGKRIELPILSSKFYKAQVLAHLPQDKQIDIKKSSFKKLSNFLKEMQSKGLLEVKELSKGVESIVSLNLKHPLLREVALTPPPIFSDNAPPPLPADEPYAPPLIKELYMVTQHLVPIFQPLYKKGDSLPACKVRSALTDYVKINELQRQNRVLLDPHLTNILISKSENLEMISWEELISRCLAKMSGAIELTFPNESPIIKKGKLEPIEISVCQRTGNKKVTLVHNLETFKLDPNKLAHEIQLLVAASTSVGPATNGKKGIQILVQGNQVRLIGKLLLDTYNIPKKYIKGMENVPAKKGKSAR